MYTDFHELNGIYLIETECNITNNLKFFYHNEIWTIFYNIPLSNIEFENIENLTITDFSLDNITIQDTIFNWKIHPNHVSSIYFSFNILMIIIVTYVLYEVFIEKFTNIINKHENNSAINTELIS